MTRADAAALRRAIVAELEGDLLPFWRQRAWDPRRGEFVRAMTAGGEVGAGAPRGLVLSARLLWTFAALYRRRGEEGDLERARRAGRRLDETLRDREHEGYLFRVDADGEVLDGSKKIYGQAFAIYAWSELYLACGEATALATARRLFDLVDRHARDDRRGGYAEARARDWSAIGDQRLSDKDLDAARSMNNHLHLLEAYTNLHRAAGDDLVAARLRELVGLFGDRFIDPRSHHLRPFFDASWRPLSDRYTYGHAIEAAWLVSEAVAELGDRRLGAEVSRWSIDLAAAVLAEGVDREGGLAYEGRGGRVIDGSREWWCQAEAVVGFWHAGRLSGDERFATAAAAVWSFIERRVVDRRVGEWHWRILADGTVDESAPKVSEWKGPYHTVRMGLEMDRRLAAFCREEP